jgi:hypothetical protein
MYDVLFDMWRIYLYVQRRLEDFDMGFALTKLACCLLCDSDKGKKFNAKKETALGEEYYGIKIFRFYIVSVSFPS